MDLTLLATLKQKLLTATEFGEVQDYFLTNFIHEQAFIVLGERTHHPLLEAVVGVLAKQLFQGTPRVEQLLLTRVKEEEFIHGGMFIDGCVGTLFYFDDTHQGLICVCTMNGQTLYARFSGRPLPRSTKPSLN